MTVPASLSLVAARRARAAGGGGSLASGVEGGASGRAAGPREEGLTVGAAGREGGRREWARARGPGEAVSGVVGLGRMRWGWMAPGTTESVPAPLCGPGQATSFSEPQFPPL